jgi:hypothetical protein
MANTIGALTFDVVNAREPGAREIIEPITRPGVDGTGYRKRGSRAPTFEARTTVLLADDAAVATHITGSNALIGTVVDVVDSADVTFSDCVVIDARLARNPAAVGLAIGAVAVGPTRLVEQSWTLCKTTEAEA